MVQMDPNGPAGQMLGSGAILQVIPIKITTKKIHVGICVYLEMMVVDGIFVCLKLLSDQLLRNCGIPQKNYICLFDVFSKVGV